MSLDKNEFSDEFSDDAFDPLYSHRPSRRKMDPYLITKIATIEQQLRQHDEDKQQLIGRQRDILNKLDGVSADITKMKGFLGGVAFVFAGLGTVIGYAIAYASSFVNSG